MSYALIKIKTFMGLEGHGLNATITKDGNPVAFVLDSANGGPTEFDFTNPGQNAKSYEQFKALAAGNEREFSEFAVKWYVESGKFAKFNAEMEEISPSCVPEATPSATDAAEMWVNHMVGAFELERALKRKAKKKTLFRLKGQTYEEGEFNTVNKPYDASVQAFLDKKYPDQVESIFGITP